MRVKPLWGFVAQENQDAMDIQDRILEGEQLPMPNNQIRYRTVRNCLQLDVKVGMTLVTFSFEIDIDPPAT